MTGRGSGGNQSASSSIDPWELTPDGTDPDRQPEQGSAATDTSAPIQPSLFGDATTSPVAERRKPHRPAKPEPFPEDFRPSERHYELGAKLGLSRDRVDAERDQCVDDSRSGRLTRTNKPRHYVNFDAAFNTWLRNAARFRNDDRLAPVGSPPADCADEVVRAMHALGYAEVFEELVSEAERPALAARLCATAAAGVPVAAEVLLADAWCTKNPTRRPTRDAAAFLLRWMSRAEPREETDEEWQELEQAKGFAELKARPKAPPQIDHEFEAAVKKRVQEIAEGKRPPITNDWRQILRDAGNDIDTDRSARA